MADGVGDITSNPGAYDGLNLYLEEGADEAKERGDEATEAAGIGEFIIGNGMQVGTHVARMMDGATCSPRLVLRARRQSASPAASFQSPASSKRRTWRCRGHAATSTSRCAPPVHQPCSDMRRIDGVRATRVLRCWLARHARAASTLAG